MTERDELREELATLDADLALAQEQLEQLRAQRDDPDALPDTSDDAVLIREFEDQREVVARLEARRRTLLEQLG
jgi:hypothetical protein